MMFSTGVCERWLLLAPALTRRALTHRNPTTLTQEPDSDTWHHCLRK